MQFVAIPLLTVAVLVAASGASALEASRLARASHDSRLGGQLAKAVDLGIQATRADPGRAEYWHSLGLAYAGVMQWRDAVAAFGRAAFLARHDARYVGDLATAYLLLGESGDVAARARARELGEQATQIDPNNPRSHLTRAVVMDALGDFSEAVLSIDRALFLDPDSKNEQLYVSATKVFLDGGRATDAIRVAREGLVLLGGRQASIGIRVDLARALLANGQPREALMELDVALLIQPNDRTVQQLRAQILASLPN